jgi:alpha-1,2-mannosyltransferase
MKTYSYNERRALWISWAGWALLFFAAASLILAGSNRTVVTSYRLAALHWFSGRIVYDGSGIGGFVYFPQAAILFAPFALLPPIVGEVLWRLVIIGVFAAGIRAFARLAEEQSDRALFPLMTLVSIPMAWDCARNGQATLALTGLMLLGIVAAARGEWWRSVLWLMLAVAVKPLALVLVLLIAAVERPMTWRIILGTVALVLFPFLTQHRHYVIQQYADCFRNMTTAVHVGVVVSGWTTPFAALRVAGIDIPERVQTLVRLLAAFGTLALCFLSKRRNDLVHSAIAVYSLAVLYLMLFSPRTENNTYAMLGPAIGVFLAQAVMVGKRVKTGALLGAMVSVLLASRVIERMLTPHAEASWVAPLVATCFCAYVLAWLFSRQASLYGEKGAA